MHVADAAFSARQDRRTEAVPRQVGNDLPGRLVPDHRAFRHLDDEILGVFSVHSPFSAGLSVLRNVFPLMTEIAQGVQSLFDFKNDVAAPAAVAAVRPSRSHVKLAAEGNVSVAAFSGFDKNSCLIRKHPYFLVKERDLSARSLLRFLSRSRFRRLRKRCTSSCLFRNARTVPHRLSKRTGCRLRRGRR